MDYTHLKCETGSLTTLYGQYEYTLTLPFHPAHVWLFVDPPEVCHCGATEVNRATWHTHKHHLHIATDIRSDSALVQWVAIGENRLGLTKAGEQYCAAYFGNGK